MAILTQKQASLQLKREKERQDTLKKKQEIQTKIEIFGENYKQLERVKLQQDLDREIGSDSSLRLYDISDLYDFTSPILLFKNKEGKALNVDLKKIARSEVDFRNSLKEVNDILKQANKALNEEEDTSQLEEEQALENTPRFKSFKADGFEESENDFPIDDELLNDDDSLHEKTMSATSLAKAQLNRIASVYFERFVPRYSKYTCSCCGKPKKLEMFYPSYNIVNNSRIDNRGTRHLCMCKECCQKLFAYNYSVVTDKDLEMSMRNVCASLNLYYDSNALTIAKQNFEDGGRKGTLLGSYVVYINDNFKGLSFIDSPIITEAKAVPEKINMTLEEAPFDWSKEDAKNKRDVVRLLGYDPFAYEDNEDDKKILYADLCSIIDEDIQQDYVKLQSAVTIVKSFTKVRKLDEKLNKMEKEDASLNDQKAVADLKVKELKAISDFSRDSGFSERFKSKQSSGENSFTGILKKMNEKKFENELANKYDIETSSTIQAAADASFTAIFKQLNLSDAEVWKIAADQLEELNKVKKENAKLTEDLRKTKYQVAELTLKEKARANGIGVDEE